ncbi:MAG: ABC transporter permease [Candidatus Eutrophobiaceae bacterium]
MTNEKPVALLHCLNRPLRLLALVAVQQWLCAVTLISMPSNAHAEDHLPQIHSEKSLRLAATTTTANTGIIAWLNLHFTKRTGIPINLVVGGSGQVLRQARQGNLDVVMVHAPQAMQKFMQEDFASRTHSIMFNRFLLLGPPNDPGWIRKIKDIPSALARIYHDEYRYVSRGDDSGVHEQEMRFVKNANFEIEPGRWIESGLGMAGSLIMANELNAYILSDTGTWLYLQDQLKLAPILYAESPLNTYYLLPINPYKHPDTRTVLTQAYIDFLIGLEGQELIANYRIGNEALFYPINKEPPSLVESTVNTAKIATEEFAPPEQTRYFQKALAQAAMLILSFDQTLYKVVHSSLWISMTATLLAALLAVPLGLWVGLRRFPGRRFLLNVLNTLMALPTVIVGLLLYGILNRQGLLGGYGFLYTPKAIILGQAILVMPIIWNLSIVAVNSVDPRLLLTCRTLGASAWQQAMVFLREARYALMAAVVAAFGRAISEVGVAMMLGGNIDGYTRTMTTSIALETSKGEFEFALALGIMLLLVAFIVNLVLQLFQETGK